MFTFNCHSGLYQEEKWNLLNWFRYPPSRNWIKILICMKWSNLMLELVKISSCFLPSCAKSLEKIWKFFILISFFTHTFSLSHTHTHNYSYTHVLLLFFSLSCSVCLSVTHTHSHTHSHTHTPSHPKNIILSKKFFSCSKSYVKSCWKKLVETRFSTSMIQLKQNFFLKLLLQEEMVHFMRS